MSYQKKNLDKKFASSTGDFCILSAPPVYLCTWVVVVRVAHICVSPEWLRPHRQRDRVLSSFVLHFAPPVAEHVVTASFLLCSKILVSILSPSPWCSFVAPAILRALSVRQWQESPSFMGSSKLAETYVISTPPRLWWHIMAIRWRGTSQLIRIRPQILVPKCRGRWM